MDNKKLFVCKECKTWLSGTPEEASKGCSECGGQLVDIVDYENWEKLSPEQQDAFKKEYLEKHDFSDNKFKTPLEVYLDERGKKGPESDYSGWISGLTTIGWLTFITFIFIGLILFALTFSRNAILGIVAFAICFCVGFMSVAMTMVFLGIAQDVRTIRSRMRK